MADQKTANGVALRGVLHGLRIEESPVTRPVTSISHLLALLADALLLLLCRRSLLI